MKRALKMLFLFVFVVGMLMTSACKNSNTGTNKPDPNTKNPVAVLVKKYESGEVKSCKHEGKTVYQCSRNANDAGSEIYDATGKKIGQCYYSTGMVDPMCEEMTECEVLYRVAGNIWGLPEVPYSK